MEITDKLVLTVNARLQDLKFEIDTIGYLQNIEEDRELSEDFAKLDTAVSLREQIPTILDEDGAEIEIPYETRSMYAIKNIMKDMGVNDSIGILKMVGKRSDTELPDLQAIVKLYESVENDVKHVLQTDLVLNFLVGKGLKTYEADAVDNVKNNVLQSVMKVLGINSEELK
jgi:hypothetical protein